MLEKLGKRKYAIPVIIAVLLPLILGFALYPTANMEVKNLPFAALNLDEGVATPQGVMNVGETMVNTITSSTDSGDDQASPIVWDSVTSQEELDEALSSNEIYGALVVPQDFSKQQLASKTAAGGTEAVAQAPSIKVIINYAKSPMVANQLSASIPTMFEQTGVPVEIEVVNDAGMLSDGTSANPISSMMSLQLGVMPLLMASLVIGVVLSALFKKERSSSRAGYWKGFGKQIAFAAVVSLIVGLLAYYVVVFVSGAEPPALEMILFMWLASFCLMVLTGGLANLAFGLGILAVVLVIACGMSAIVLPYEVLPSFWQDWIYVWVPQNYLSLGFREVFFLGEGVWNSGSTALVIEAAVGLVCACVSGLLPKKAESAVGE